MQCLGFAQQCCCRRYVYALVQPYFGTKSEENNALLCVEDDVLCKLIREYHEVSLLQSYGPVVDTDNSLRPELSSIVNNIITLTERNYFSKLMVAASLKS